MPVSCRFKSPEVAELILYFIDQIERQTLIRHFRMNARRDFFFFFLHFYVLMQPRAMKHGAI